MDVKITLDFYKVAPSINELAVMNNEYNVIFT